MDEIEAHRRHGRLVDAVAETRELLVALGEDHWGNWMDAVDRELRAHDAHGLTRLVRALGGMGSFNDLVIHPINGHHIEAEGVSEANDKLRTLQSRMYQGACALLHDLER